MLGYLIIAAKHSANGCIGILSLALLFFLFLIYIAIKTKIKNVINRLANEKVDIILRQRIHEITQETQKIAANLKQEQNKIDDKLARLNDLQNALNKIIEERQIGFPWIANRIAKATAIICKNSYQKSRRYDLRGAIEEIEVLKGLIDFHEYLYPHLKDLHVKIEETPLEENSHYTQSEKSDNAHYWLTPEEYRKLPSAERNQLALDRYRKKHLSDWEVGKRYERYIGYLYERRGYKVDYDGITLNMEDRGRDLICTKDNEIIIIQCKNWSESKTIYEKHIFQFFGTVYYARMEEQRKNELYPRHIKGLFYATTKLSNYALEAAKALDIEVNFEPIDKNYPCIKCNIRDGEKIYHLPFDQLYDRAEIKPNTGEFYAKTCQEAENAGFRRAMRHFY